MREPDIPVALTFDDVLIVPRRTTVSSRSEISTATRLSRNLELEVPIVSANMDSVTESAMAIELARLGGIGIIHRFMTLEDQVGEVHRVKRSESIVIEAPHTLGPEDSLGDARDLMKRQNISGLPVTSGERRLVGILTRRDLLFEEDDRRPIREVMTGEDDLVTAPAGTKPEEARALLHEHRIEKLPLVDGEGRLAGLITSTDIVKRERFPHASKDAKGRLRVGAAIGVQSGYLDRARSLVEAECDVLVVDIAHGHSDQAIEAVRRVREELGDVELIAGNVATSDGARDLVEAGVDAVKVGVGPGSICTTRVVTGAGVPQLTAILSAVRGAEEVPVIADGGIRTSGDITKALAAGASSVMIGSLLAGTDESPGITLIRNGRKYKISRGMASLGAAMGREAREEESDDDRDFEDVVPEGVEAMVPYKGEVREVIRQLVGGLRSGISYAGCRSIAEMWGRVRFCRMTGAGQKESQPHDVEVLG